MDVIILVLLPAVGVCIPWDINIMLDELNESTCSLKFASRTPSSWWYGLHYAWESRSAWESWITRWSPSFTTIIVSLWSALLDLDLGLKCIMGWILFGNVAKRDIILSHTMFAFNILKSFGHQHYTWHSHENLFQLGPMEHGLVGALQGAYFKMNALEWNLLGTHMGRLVLMMHCGSMYIDDKRCRKHICQG